MAIEAGLSAATGGACALGAGLLYLSEKLPGLRSVAVKIQADRVQVALIGTATVGLVSTPAGAWWQSTVTTIDAWAVDLVGEYAGVIITGASGLVSLMIVVSDMITRNIRLRTRILAAALPVLAVTIPGTTGEAIAGGLGAIAGVLGEFVGGLLGVG